MTTNIHTATVGQKGRILIAAQLVNFPQPPTATGVKI